MKILKTLKKIKKNKRKKVSTYYFENITKMVNIISGHISG